MPFETEVIGPCTLYRGDALEILPTLPAGKIKAIITDPPYSSGGAYRGDRVQTTVAKYVQSGVQLERSDFTGDNRDQHSFLVWCSLWMSAARHASAPGAVLCSFIDWRQVPTLTDAVQCGGWVWRNLCTWVKPGVRMQKGRFSGSAEYVVYATNGPHDQDEGECSPQNWIMCAPVAAEDKEHIAEKPLAVVKWAMSVSAPDALVCDPFMGSGTTAEAVIGTKRTFIGFEIDKQAFDGACLRLTKVIAESERRDRALGIVRDRPSTTQQSLI